MTFPVPGPATAELVRAFVEVTHEALKRAETAEAELAEERKLAAALGLDNRALKDRLQDSETVRRADADELRQVRREAERLGGLLREARDTDVTPLRQGSRDHLGPVVRCWCGMTHGAGQVTALNTVPPGAAVVGNVADELVREAKELPKDSKERVMVTADWLVGLAGRLRAAAGRDRIEANK